MNWNWITKFPLHPAMGLLGWFLILATGLTVIVHLILGHPMPDGYDGWFIFMGGVAGINVTAMGVRRTTDYEYQKLKSLAKGDTANVSVKVDAKDPGDNGGI